MPPTSDSAALPIAAEPPAAPVKPTRGVRPTRGAGRMFGSALQAINPSTRTEPKRNSGAPSSTTAPKPAAAAPRVPETPHHVHVPVKVTIPETPPPAITRTPSRVKSKHVSESNKSPSPPPFSVRKGGIPPSVPPAGRCKLIPSFGRTSYVASPPAKVVTTRRRSEGDVHAIRREVHDFQVVDATVALQEEIKRLVAKVETASTLERSLYTKLDAERFSHRDTVKELARVNTRREYLERENEQLAAQLARATEDQDDMRMQINELQNQQQHSQAHIFHLEHDKRLVHEQYTKLYDMCCQVQVIQSHIPAIDERERALQREAFEARRMIAALNQELALLRASRNTPPSRRPGTDHAGAGVAIRAPLHIDVPRSPISSEHGSPTRRTIHLLGSPTVSAALPLVVDIEESSSESDAGSPIIKSHNIRFSEEIAPEGIRDILESVPIEFRPVVATSHVTPTNINLKNGEQPVMNAAALSDSISTPFVGSANGVRSAETPILTREIQQDNFVPDSSLPEPPQLTAPFDNDAALEQMVRIDDIIADATHTDLGVVHHDESIAKADVPQYSEHSIAHIDVDNGAYHHVEPSKVATDVESELNHVKEQTTNHHASHQVVEHINSKQQATSTDRVVHSEHDHMPIHGRSYQSVIPRIESPDYIASDSRLRDETSFHHNAHADRYKDVSPLEGELLEDADADHEQEESHFVDEPSFHTAYETSFHNAHADHGVVHHADVDPDFRTFHLTDDIAADKAQDESGPLDATSLHIAHADHGVVRHAVLDSGVGTLEAEERDRHGSVEEFPRATRPFDGVHHVEDELRREQTGEEIVSLTSNEENVSPTTHALDVVHHVDANHQGLQGIVEATTRNDREAKVDHPHDTAINQTAHILADLDLDTPESRVSVLRPATYAAWRAYEHERDISWEIHEFENESQSSSLPLSPLPLVLDEVVDADTVPELTNADRPPLYPRDEDTIGMDLHALKRILEDLKAGRDGSAADSSRLEDGF
ncbi:hypothetical protein HKX48_008455 [Thoreauomyces humboldtii]|nr:hypothetical protein HKX48_008455 [Thoreauomyces humboldtii]